MFKKNRWAVLWLAAFIVALVSVAHAELRTMSGHVPAVVSTLTPIGQLSSTGRLDLAIGLPLRNEAQLKNLLRELYDPASTNFHHFLTPVQFTAQFGPTKEDYQKVIDYAQTNGFTVTHTHGNRVLVDVNGKVSDLERVFHVTLRTYRHPTEGRNFFAPDVEPSIDQSLPVQDVSGLSDYSIPKPLLHPEPYKSAGVPAAGSGPRNGYIGQDFRRAYVPGTQLDGSGQMVGVLQLTGYDPNDIFAYENQAGLPNVPLQNVLIDGYSGAPESGQEETCLDIEMAISMATNLASVVVFEGPNATVYWTDILNTMAASNQIKQFSCSWGFSGSPNATVDGIFQQMAAQGQSFFQASGDGDAWTNPIWEPAESPYLTVVGGTTLAMSGAGIAYSSEHVWNWGNTGSAWGPNGDGYWGSGGGVSGSYTIPDWQTNVNMTTNLGSTFMRNIPDVALTSDNVYATSGSGSNDIYGGTSCAAPLWAGFMALVNQQGMGKGAPAAGFINPAIYALGNGTNYTACFHDITLGDNKWSGSLNLYSAVPGYDLCTGWGTPNGTNLINALVGLPDPLEISPLNGFSANGAVRGAFNLTQQTFSLENAGLAPITWSLINTSAWLTVSEAGGVLVAGDQTGVTVGLSPAANALPVGVYTASILVTNNTTSAAEPRTFILQVGQSLVVDGGFESGTFCHWTLVGNTITSTLIYNGVQNPGMGFAVVHSGKYGAFLGDTQLAVLSQNLPTIPGQEYLVSFWLNNSISGAIQQFEVNWNTNVTITNTLYYVLNPPVFDWTNLNFVVAATSTNTALQFGAENQPNCFGLDDITVTPIPAPSFSAVSNAVNGLQFTWYTLPNVSYVVQYTTNLLQSGWVNLGNPVTALTNTLTVLDTNTFDVSPERFYRISISP